ncbi:MAG: isoprenoid biosynthesis glyoxalase ElbB [Opitutales bacterium]|nr:isoprenoid biosynthesis glyoxalase ElbB [Opitutales bacterium]
MQEQGGKIQQKKAAIILSGCGVFDGSEITEAVAAIFGVCEAGAKPYFFAPDMEQAEVVNHLTGKIENEKRNVLAESARIARGEISDLKDFKPEEFDAAIFVGGFGAAKNLSTFAYDGAGAKICQEAERAVLGMYNLNKPLGFVCIAPASVGAVVLGKFGVELTIGSDPRTAAQLEKTGARHVECAAADFHKDPSSNVYSTPAYMLAQSPLDVLHGVGKMARAMLK